MTTQAKQRIQQAIQQFHKGSLRHNSLHLLEALGYPTDRQIESENVPELFLEMYPSNTFRRDKALVEQWRTTDILCQISDAEIHQSNQMILLDSKGKTIDNSIIESYLFLAIDLRDEQYTRTELAQITREVNKLFPMPVMLIFRHGQTLTISIINRRLHKRDSGKDVLEKVTLIKDIRLANPHRAHVEILFDLSLDELHRVHDFSNFVELHRAWQKTLDSSELNKKFFKEIADWYFWAVNEVTFPSEAGPDETRNATSVIRLITRLIFVWFIKEKGLIPDELFNRPKLDELLVWDDFNDSTYYKAILQNLFFATLNQEMNTEAKPDNRKFRGTRQGGQDQHHMIHNVYRYERYFQDPQSAIALFADVPFLNGGLFECLDKRIEGQAVRVDGFSDRADNPLRVPDALFFGAERTIDLNETYGTSGKVYKVRGLIETLSRYKFTIAENTPIEEEIALDPELLGKVFENLLAAYNPETGTTARKQTGSFYTPREIVNYMVDKSLLAYLQTKLTTQKTSEVLKTSEVSRDLEGRLRHLFAYNEEPHQFSPAETKALIRAIDTVNILDPACGSGAFPMGILHKLVFILGKLDPHNEQWKERQIEPLRQAIRAALAIPDSRIRNQTVQELEEQVVTIELAFSRNELDYGRKLYLIENCIYGVDIQPVAVQIAKLRFFISLVVDQRLDDGADNRGILPLPNLETKFVAANTLLGIAKPAQMALRNPEITAKEQELAEVRSKHFRARTPRTKEKWRGEDKRLRAEISDLLKEEGNLRNKDVQLLATWDPYNQNIYANFFDPEWMFGLENGFDIVVGNPPYIDSEGMVNSGQKELRDYLSANFQFTKGNWDIYIAFFEVGFKLLNENGHLAYITPDKWLSKPFGNTLRKNKLGNLQAILVSGRDIFATVNVDSVVTFFSNDKTPQIEVFQYENDEPIFFNKVDKRIIKPPYALDFLFSDNLGFLLKLEAYPNRLSDLAKCENACATSDAYKLKPLLQNLRFANEFDPKDFYQVINTGTIDKFISKWGYREMVYLKDKYLYPVVERKSFTHNFKNTYAIKTKQQKIIMKGLTLLDACIDYNGNVIPGKSTLIICHKDERVLKFLLGLINSKLPIFYIKNKYPASSYNTGINFTKDMINDLPLPQVSDQIKESIIKNVNNIISEKSKDFNADVSPIEGKIDELVYALYGLTPAEIALVEGRELSDEEEAHLQASAVVAAPAKRPNNTITSIPPLLFTGQPPQGSFSQRLNRVQALAKQATPAAIQELTAALTDDRDAVIWVAKSALRQMATAEPTTAQQVIGVLQAFIAQTDHPAAKAEAEKILSLIQP
ncbi:MAG: Eco57I restriction-modification methylase domain-containing protein [Ardenticatenaceae bacterium]|nr:Eco57I restriction-modification methylase domain-containing protein [Ardenticatenaceae bacterium]